MAPKNRASPPQTAMPDDRQPNETAAQAKSPARSE